MDRNPGSDSFNALSRVQALGRLARGLETERRDPTNIAGQALEILAENLEIHRAGLWFRERGHNFINLSCLGPDREACGKLGTVFSGATFPDVLEELRMSGSTVVSSSRRREISPPFGFVSSDASNGAPLLLTAFSNEKGVRVLISLERGAGGADWTGEEREFALIAANLVGLQLENGEMRDLEEALHSSRQRLALHILRTPMGAIEWDENFRVVDWNPSAERIFGYSRAEALGRHAYELIVPADATREEVDLIWKNLLQREGGERSDNWNITADGRRIFCEWYNTPLIQEDGRVIGAASLVQDVTTHRDAVNKLRVQAYQDSLTGLYNRYGFEDRLEHAIAQVRRNRGAYFLLLLDLDQFKIINDHCGHAAGDEFLRRLSDLFHLALGGDEALARLGGDEFAFLLKSEDPDHGRQIAEVLRGTVRNFQFVWEDQVFSLNASIGGAAIDNETLNARTLLLEAENACYAAKELGRNRICFTGDDETILEQRREEMHWAAELQGSRQGKNLLLYVQAILPLRDSAQKKGREGIMFEVLLRLKDKDGRLVSPGDFIPAAERYYLMADLDRWTAEETIRSLKRNPELLNSCGHVALNVSGQTLSNEDYISWLYACLKAEPDIARRLCFEITETAAIAQISRASSFLEELRLLGCACALDDFGSGLSSFAYLKDLPLDYIKIDGSLVRNITTDRNSYAIVKSIIELGRALDLGVIAEYVSSAEILRALVEMGAEFVQGYEIEKPRPLVELQAGVRNFPGGMESSR